jgi:hypothetical protein
MRMKTQAKLSTKKASFTPKGGIDTTLKVEGILLELLSL